jgi:hypothetical protein
MKWRKNLVRKSSGRTTADDPHPPPLAPLAPPCYVSIFTLRFLSLAANLAPRHNRSHLSRHCSSPCTKHTPAHLAGADAPCRRLTRVVAAPPPARNTCLPISPGPTRPASAHLARDIIPAIAGDIIHSAHLAGADVPCRRPSRRGRCTLSPPISSETSSLPSPETSSTTSLL